MWEPRETRYFAANDAFYSDYNVFICGFAFTNRHAGSQKIERVGQNCGRCTRCRTGQKTLKRCKWRIFVDHDKMGVTAKGSELSC